MLIDKLEKLWNSQADKYNQWDTLSLDEMLEFAQKQAISEKTNPEPVRCHYMRDNFTFRSLPLDVEDALRIMREEIDAGATYGMLCGSPYGVVPMPAHATTAEEWPMFEAKARAWMEQAVAASMTNKNYGDKWTIGAEKS